MTQVQIARFSLGQIVRHRDDAFRGVVIDVDAAYAGPMRETGDTSPNQPFYRVFVTGTDGGFVAYAAEGALEGDADELAPADQRRWVSVDDQGRHAPPDMRLH
jgi:heat shock protein HspQ